MASVLIQKFHPRRSSRRKDNNNSKEQHEAKERNSAPGRKRQPYAALASVHGKAPYFVAPPGQHQLEPPYVRCYNVIEV